MTKVIIKKGKLLYRTATTDYTCFLPDLGEFTGAGRIRLTLCKITTIFCYYVFIKIYIIT